MRKLTPEFILEKLAHGEEQGQFAAVALFVDTAGFTPLTSALQEHGTEGAEIVAQVVTNLFAPLMHVVYHHGGWIAGFAGDACKAIFPGLSAESYQRALTAAWQIRQQVLAQPTQTTRFGTFSFTIKVTVAAGNIDWRIWQGQATAQQATALFGGEALEAALAADRFARDGEIILTPTVAAQVALDGITLEPVGAYFRLSAWPRLPARLPAGKVDIPPTPPTLANLELASRFFPIDLLERQSQGEFRRVVTVFINLQSLPGASTVPTFATTLFRLLAQYGGYLCRIGQIGDQDQGGTLLLFWGAPASHEQDVAHALQFVLDLQAVAPCALRAGVTTHLAYSGFVGSSWREEYTCYGAHVNLAARQMVTAGWGEIWLDEQTARLATANFASTPQGDFLFKGFPTAKAVNRLLGRRESALENFYQGEMVGRQAELAQLQAALAPLATGKFGRVVIISGEAGIGKSRLVHEFQNRTRINADERGYSETKICVYSRLLASKSQWFLCQTDELLRQPLNPFRYWLRRYFNQSISSDEAANKAAFTVKLDELLAYLQTLTAVSRQSPVSRVPSGRVSPVSSLVSELTRTRSFLAALVDLHWPDSLYAQVEPHLRYENTLTALKTLILAESLCRPVILHLEDAHWLDETSRAFLARLTHNVDEYPFAIVVTTRPPEEETGRHETRDTRPGGSREMVDVPQVTIRLATLPAVEITALAAAQLRGTPAPALVNLLLERAEGNPFFAEQLLHYLQDQGWLVQGVDGWQLRTEQVPTTLLPNGARALLVARLDRLPQPVKEVVQTAAVLGREFDTQVLARMVADDTKLAAKLAVADRAAIWSAMTQARYLFRHALLREAAYDMQLRAQLRLLHQRAATAIQQCYGTDLTPHLGDLAYHYDLAEIDTMAAAWYGQAGEQAAKQYANEVAARYFLRALDLTPVTAPDVRYQLLLGSEAAHHWLGQRQRQQDDLAQLQALTDPLPDAAKRAEVLLRKTAFHLSTGRYQEAAQDAERAVALAGQAGDDLAAARAYHRWGRACWQASDYQRAYPHLTHALQLARANQAVQVEAQSLYDLAMIEYYQKAFDHALENVNQAARLFASVHDQQGNIYCLSLSAVIFGEMGNYIEAAAQFDVALQTCRQIGLRYAEARLLGQSGDNELNLGALTASYERHTQALKLYQEIGDQEGIATSLDTMGLLLTFLARPVEAQKHYQEALALHRAIHDQRGEGYVLTHLGYLLIEQQAWPQAAAVLEQALALRRARVEEGLLLDTLAAYALVVATRDQAAALPYVDEILDWLTEHGVAGIEFPGQVYLSCYRVLAHLAQAQPTDQPRALQILAAGYAFLQERAQRIQDVTLRQSFLQNLPFHRELMTFWQAQANTI